MGAACCGGKSNTKGETNLQTRGKGGVTDLKDIPIATVIKAQSLMRGFIARRRVKKTYGFEMRTGLMGNRNNPNLDPDELEKQRQRVHAIRERLPAFEYGLYQDEDFEPNVNKESRPMLIL
jgi:hypothetical protein